MSKTNKSKSGSRSSRSRSASRSRSRSFSKSRSRSRSVSRSRKRRLSSRSRSRSYSPAHNRERNHPRVYQNRDFRGHNRGYRRPYYFRGRNRGFYPWGQYNRGGYGNYRSNWQNYRQAYSPRRGRSRSRSPKRRSPSPRSRSHSRNSDKSSSDRSRRSSSSRSSSNHSRVESSKRKSAKDKKSSSKDSRPSQAAGDNQGDEAKDQTFSGGTSQDTKASESSKQWPDATTYSTGSASRASAVSDLSPRERSPALKSPLQSVVVRRRSPRPSPVPKPSPPLSNTSQMGSTLPGGAGYQSGTHQGQFDHGSGSLSPSKKSPVGKSPPATGSTYSSSQKEESAASGGAAYTKRQVSCFPSPLLAQERKLCRDLVHSNKKEQEFRSIFQHIQSAQSQRSPSELFAQHIVTIVHHVKEHHFGSSGMTLHERFTKYLKRGTEQEAAKNKKSPEIHRRIDISPSTFRKHGLAHEEMKSPREPGYKTEGKYKDDPVDLRLDIERRKKHKERDLKRGKSRESVDSRDSSRSRERSTEKTEKTHKGSKKQKKHRRARDRSRSSSSSSQSSHSYKAEEYPEEPEEREESTTGFDKSRLGTKDFMGPSERGGGRARGTFQFRARGRGWGRGNYSGNNNNNSNNDFQKRNREEEWDPEYTPKSKKYYLHDDREGEGSDKWVSRGRGRGAFPRGRGRFMFRKSSTSPKWAHDKFSGEEGEIEDDESGTENREEKDSLQPATE
uniref:Thyroid hormone receptor-associated protein 3 n=1 Tax=Castor canadensis TaxID=51338 RepID=A0A250YL46_CASCN